MITVAPASMLPDLERRLTGLDVSFEPLGPSTRGLVWADGGPTALSEALQRAPEVAWVQLGSAGVDAYAAAGMLDPRITWTSAKGAYARPVAEHALTLLLALLRDLQARARASSWGPQSGRSLHGQRVLIVGAGGIAGELLRLLQVWDAQTAVVRRGPGTMPGADRTVRLDALDEEIGLADAVILAMPLTAETRGMLDARRIGLMRRESVLVNVARGAVLDTAALLHALDEGAIAGAALDVTDPEPLPAGHRLWQHPRALITPHTADTPEMIRPLLADRAAANIRRFLSGEPLLGVVDPARGY